jgi:hypothetical protein
VKTVTIGGGMNDRRFRGSSVVVLSTLCFEWRCACDVLDLICIMGGAISRQAVRQARKAPVLPPTRADVPLPTNKPVAKDFKDSSM